MLVLLASCTPQQEVVHHVVPVGHATVTVHLAAPTPQPTIKPVPHLKPAFKPVVMVAATATPKEVFDLWPGDDAWAARIISCESGWTLNEISSTDDWGLFQIHRERGHVAAAAAMGYTWAQMLELRPNVRMAWHVYQTEGPGAWTCNG